MLSTWRGEDLSGVPCQERLKVVLSEDIPETAGFFNINRQIVLCASGIDLIPPHFQVIKLRSDQRVNVGRVVDELHALPPEKLLTTDSFTRTDRLFHPSDMLMGGPANLLRAYFSLGARSPLSEIETKLLIARKQRRSEPIIEWPETWLFLNYLRLRGNYPEEINRVTSKMAIEENFAIVTARSVRLKWAKFYSGWIAVRPYSFDLPPFEGALIENARCVSLERFQMPSWIAGWLWSAPLYPLRSGAIAKNQTKVWVFAAVKVIARAVSGALLGLHFGGRKIYRRTVQWLK